MSDSELPDFPVSRTTFDMVSRDAGFVTLNSKSLLAAAGVGDVVKKMGALKIGRAKLLLADEQIGRAFERCFELTDPNQIGDEGLPLTVSQKLNAFEVLGHLGKARATAAGDMIRSVGIDLSDSAKPTCGIPSFIPHQKSIPVVTAEVILEAQIAKAKQK